MNLTKRAIQALKPPEKGRVYHHDSKQTNLSLCITSKDARTWYRTGRIDGQPVRIKIGRWPDVSTEQARSRAKEIAGDLVRGNNPRKPKKQGVTLTDIWEDWSLDAKERKRTYTEDLRKWNRYFG
ncbi:MAG: DUF4102 domain-containing protein, partial [Planctomycetes bacterium]|nr:DUF4102 domain-containing protein [Planctomycetota bacterium]